MIINSRGTTFSEDCRKYGNTATAGLQILEVLASVSVNVLGGQLDGRLQPIAKHSAM